MSTIILKKFGEYTAGRPLLVFFPHTGSGVAPYANLVRSLKLPINICGIQLPGREERTKDDVINSFPNAVEAAAESLRDVDENTFFWGHSLGARLAFATAAALEKSGRRLRGIILTSMAPPGVEMFFPLKKSINEANDEELIAALRHMGMAESLFEDQGLRYSLLRVIRADLNLLGESEHASDVISTKLFTICGKEDPYVRFESLKNWAKYSSTEVVNIVVPGNHFFIFSESRAFGNEIIKILLA